MTNLFFLFSIIWYKQSNWVSGRETGKSGKTMVVAAKKILLLLLLLHTARGHKDLYWSLIDHWKVRREGEIERERWACWCYSDLCASVMDLRLQRKRKSMCRVYVFAYEAMRSAHWEKERSESKDVMRVVVVAASPRVTEKCRRQTSERSILFLLSLYGNLPHWGHT